MNPEAAASVAAASDRRWPRRVAFGVAGLAVLLPSSTAGAGWYFAAQVLTPAREHPLLIRAVNDDEITLTRTEDTERDIPLGLGWQGGHAQLGAVVTTDRASVVRKLTAVTRGTCRAGTRAYTTGSVFDGDPRAVHGLDYTSVFVRGELGHLPAWLVPGTDPTTWTIAVHGRGANRSEALRALPVLAASGATTLIVTYRNDLGAPAARDGCYHLGATEWRDLVPAVAFARARGAERIILYGWSMGAAIVLNTLRNTEVPGLVGAIFDCPVIDWVTTLRMQAAQRRLPGALTWSAMRLIQQRIGVRLTSLDFRDFEMAVPTLLFLDGDDRIVAPEPTREFAEHNAGTVRLVETAGGGHVRSWNVARERYEAELAAFLPAV
jgi:pimeloyl-ACP methyl ester carboxylesterase